jgi:virulence factor Mce-like protein
VLRRRLIGIAVIVAAVAIVVLATVRPDPFKDTRSVYARFDSAQGIGSIDRNVRVGGANAGEIGEVRREEDDVIVELVLEEGIRVGTDAHAKLRPHTLFEGSAFVDLFPGSPGAPDLEQGDLIPEAQTDVYVSLDEATRLFRTDNREKLKQILGSSEEILREQAIAGLRRTLRETPALFEELAPASRAVQGSEREELAAGISGLSRTVEALADREQDLVPLAQRASRTAAALAVDEGGPLDRAVAALPGPLEELAANGDLLVDVVDRLDSLAVELEPAAHELAPLLREARPLLRRGTPIVERSTPLISGLGVVLERLAGAAPSLERAISTLDPGIRQLTDSVLPVLTGDGQLGVPVYAQLGGAFSGMAAALRPYQTDAQGLGSTGHILRLGFYPDPGMFELRPFCGTIADLDPEIAAQLESMGLCKP